MHVCMYLCVYITIGTCYIHNVHSSCDLYAHTAIMPTCIDLVLVCDITHATRAVQFRTQNADGWGHRDTPSVRGVRESCLGTCCWAGTKTHVHTVGHLTSVTMQCWHVCFLLAQYSGLCSQLFSTNRCKSPHTVKNTTRKLRPSAHTRVLRISWVGQGWSMFHKRLRFSAESLLHVISKNKLTGLLSACLGRAPATSAKEPS